MSYIPGLDGKTSLHDFLPRGQPGQDPLLYLGTFTAKDPTTINFLEKPTETSSDNPIPIFWSTVYVRFPKSWENSEEKPTIDPTTMSTTCLQTSLSPYPPKETRDTVLVSVSPSLLQWWGGEGLHGTYVDTRQVDVEWNPKESGVRYIFSFFYSNTL